MQRLHFFMPVLLAVFLLSGPALATEVTLQPIKDNTLYQSTTGTTSNGAGEYFFVGKTGGGSLRRGLLAFEVAGNVPAGATINSITLALHMSRTIAGNQTVSLHRVLAGWGEGSSNAGSNEGGGGPATTGDATWLHRFFNAALWSTPGGDFAAAASATTPVGGIGSYTWNSTAQLVADVQLWLDSPSQNFGWLVRGNESANTTAKRFDSRENVTPSFRPTLTINFSGGSSPPVITLRGANPLVLPVGTPYVEPGFTATDNEDGDITANVVATGSVNHVVLGKYVLRYNVTDSSGNPAVERTRTVDVVDTAAPVITLVGDNPVTLDVGTAYVEPGYIATDNYEGNITAKVVVSGTLNQDVLGIYTLKYNVKDSSGNPAEEKTRTVSLVDTTPPMITLLGDNPVTLEVGTVYAEAGYTATDNYDGDVTAKVAVTGSVNHTGLGIYLLQYNVTDSSGNPAQEKTRTVKVVDATAPVIALSGASTVTLEVGTAYAEPGYTATDNHDGDITASVVVTGSVDHNVLGAYLIHYNASDSSGNPAEQKTRVVNVVDTTAPVVALLGDNPMTIELGTLYSEPGFTATDNYDGDMSANVVITGSVDHTVEGIYILHYSVSDFSGNPAEEKTRTVNVVATPPFEVTDIVEAGLGVISLTWNSRPGATYTVWSCSDLQAGPWSEEATVSSEGDTTTWTDPDTLSPRKFYRVQIE